LELNDGRFLPFFKRLANGITLAAYMKPGQRYVGTFGASMLMEWEEEVSLLDKWPAGLIKPGS